MIGGLWMSEDCAGIGRRAEVPTSQSGSTVVSLAGEV